MSLDSIKTGVEKYIADKKDLDDELILFNESDELLKDVIDFSSGLDTDIYTSVLEIDEAFSDSKMLIDREYSKLQETKNLLCQEIYESIERDKKVEKTLSELSDARYNNGIKESLYKTKENINDYSELLDTLDESNSDKSFSDLSKKNLPEISDFIQNDNDTISPEIYLLNVANSRPLTNEEIDNLSPKLGWGDKQFQKCTIDDNGVIYYKTDRFDLLGKTGKQGVPYRNKTVTINGVQVSGVFPVFESKADIMLDSSLFSASSAEQFAECDRQLKNRIKTDPEFKKQFSTRQLHDIYLGKTPKGYTWHHNEEPGKMQLVKTRIHARELGGAAHTGGKALWGWKYTGKANN